MGKLNSMLNWDRVKSVGEVKLFKTSYLVFLFLPPIAKFLHLFPESITLPWVDKSISLVLSLPFSWIAFFWAACFASIGHFTYVIFCPYIVKEFSDFSSFKHTERNGVYLREAVSSLADLKQSNSFREKIEAINAKYATQIDQYSLSKVLNDDSPVNPQHFYQLRDAATVSMPISRWIAAISYFIGLLFIFIVLAQNIKFVFLAFI